MNTNLLCYRGLSKSLYLIMLSVLLTLVYPLSAQRKAAPKPKTSKPAKNRIIYGLASFYHNKFNGRETSSGEIFSQSKFTCACNMLPLGTWVKITNMRNDRSVVVKVNDRLHPRMKRIADLSKIAAQKLGYLGWGITRVKVEVYGKTRP